MIIQHNISALNSYNKLSNNNSSVSKNLSKLSSGYRINSAADDAAGLAISEKMRSQITGLDRAKLNAQDGISLVQTGEGALTEVHSMLNRLVELGTESANGTIQATDRQKIQDEVNALTEEIDRISQATNFNGINLLDGSLGGGAVSIDGAVLSGANVSDFSAATVDTIAINIDMTAKTLDDDIDTFVVDGQELTIDWSKAGSEAKKVFDTLNKDLLNLTADEGKEIAKKLTDLFNNEMKAQGVSGSVTFKFDSTSNKISMTSGNTGESSKIGFAGTKSADPTQSLGAVLFDATGAGISNIKDAGKTFNSTVVVGDHFAMEINGTKVDVTGVAITRGTAMDDGTAGDAQSLLEAQIQAAVGKYNTAMSTAGTDEALTATDFVVEVDKSGGFNVIYKGDKEVNFSFSETVRDGVEGKAANLLGLASGTSVSNGVSGKGLTLQVGDTSDDFNKVTVRIDDMSSLGLGLNNLKVTDQGLSSESIDKVNSAIEKVSVNRGRLGALQNRLEHTINNLSTTSENLTSAESRIRDTDMAKEMMNFTKNNVLVQAAQSMLAQANQQPQQVLQLLR